MNIDMYKKSNKLLFRAYIILDNLRKTMGFFAPQSLIDLISEILDHLECVSKLND